MASRLLSSKAFSGLKPVIARQLAASHKASSLVALKNVQMRMQSTEANSDPKAVAGSIISMFPGDSLAAKSSSVLVTASIAAYLISKEIYVIDAEFFEMLALFGAYYVWYSGGKEGAAAYLEGRKQAITKVLTQAREDHKSVVKERMAHIGKLSDAVEVTQGLYEMSKDIATLEAQAYELKQKVAFNSEIKTVLDSWVRHEANVREQEQKRLVSHVIEKIKADLLDPKLQQAILQQTIADVEKIAASSR